MQGCLSVACIQNIRTHLATSPTRGPRSRSEVRGSRFEVRGPRFEVRGPRSEVRGPRSKARGPRFEARGPRFEVRGRRSEVRGPRSEVRGKGQSGETNFFLSKPTFFPRCFCGFPSLHGCWTCWFTWVYVVSQLDLPCQDVVHTSPPCWVYVGSATMTLGLGWVYVYVGSAMLGLYVGLCWICWDIHKCVAKLALGP